MFFVVITTYMKNSDILWLLIGLPSATLIGVIGYFILWWILLSILLPGDSNVTTDSAEDAVARVSTTQLTLLGLISFVIYKLSGKKEVTEKIESPASTTPEVDMLVNTI